MEGVITMGKMHRGSNPKNWYYQSTEPGSGAGIRKEGTRLFGHTDWTEEKGNTYTHKFALAYRKKWENSWPRPVKTPNKSQK